MNQISDPIRITNINNIKDFIKYPVHRQHRLLG